MRGRLVGAAALAALVGVTGAFVTAAPSCAGAAVASASLVAINGREVGSAVFRQGPGGTLVATVTATIDQQVTANPSEFHGLHLHAGSAQGCVTYAPGTEPAPADRFTEVGGHWAAGPTVQPHGSHAGDLPSLTRRSDGMAEAVVVLDKATVGDLVGKAVVVHHLADDFGKHPSIGTSERTGNAGPRYACGVVAASAGH